MAIYESDDFLGELGGLLYSPERAETILALAVGALGLADEHPAWQLAEARVHVQYMRNAAAWMADLAKQVHGADVGSAAMPVTIAELNNYALIHRGRDWESGELPPGITDMAEYLSRRAVAAAVRGNIEQF